MSEPDVAKLLPLYIELETSTYCNRTCGWCPNSVYDRGRSQELIGDKLYEKIIRDLQNTGFTGTLALHNYNEPLYDPKIIDRIRLADQDLDAKIAILTNGDLLTESRATELVEAGVDFLRVTLYWAIGSPISSPKVTSYIERIGMIGVKSASDNFGERIKGVIGELETELYIPDPTRFTNRAGALNGFGKGHGHCYLPFDSCAIDVLGNMKICCEVYPVIPAHIQHGIVGRLSEKSFMELWLSEQMNELRRSLLKGGNSNPLCLSCGLKVKNAQSISETRLREWSSYLTKEGD